MQSEKRYTVKQRIVQVHATSTGVTGKVTVGLDNYSHLICLKDEVRKGA